MDGRESSIHHLLTPCLSGNRESYGRRGEETNGSQVMLDVP
jgi:hypothetical protein